MKIIFISNYFNHHQKQLADELYRLTGGGYRFFATESMSQERKSLGWGVEMPDYVVEVGTTLTEERQREVDEADVVILGGEPYEFVKNRIQQKKLTFLFTERLFKKEVGVVRRIKSAIVRMPKWRRKNAYLLCAGGYVSADFYKSGCFKNKAYRWGYFPPFEKVDDTATLLEKKQNNSLLWCARYIDWKHPEMAIEVARRLKADGYDFSLTMIGEGELLEEMQAKIKEEGLQENVRFTGAIPFGQVREEMKKAQVFLFTSDREEGWGAVLAESMNAGMAAVSSHAIGATPYLIEDGKSGYVFESGDIDDLYCKVKDLLDNPAKREEMGKNAYLTIEKDWNAAQSATRLMQLIECLQQGKETPFEDGPCSKAPPIKDDWYKGKN